MRRSILISIFCLLAVSSSIAQIMIANATVRYKKNGVWHPIDLEPGDSTTINVDHGTPIDITVRRKADASLPVVYWFSDWHNNSFLSHWSSDYSYTFEDCVGPLDATITFGVTTNLGSIKINVNWTNPPTPDLAVSNISSDGSVSPAYDSYQVGQTISIKCNVHNVGNSTAGSSRLAYYIKNSAGNTSGSPIMWSQVPMLPRGTFSPQERNYTFTANDVGTRYIVLEADYLNQVQEENENNNIRSFGPFQVVAPPNVGITPLSYNFGTVNVNNCSQEHDFILTNNGNTSVSGKVMLRNTRNFTIVSGEGNYNLAPEQSKTIKVKFCPEAAGVLSNNLRVFADGVSSPLVQANITGTGHVPPQAIVGISPEFVFDTRLFNSGGIYLEINETAGTDTKMVKKVGYRYSYKKRSFHINHQIADHKFEVPKDGRVFLTPPNFPDSIPERSKIDFLDQIILFDEDDNQIGHINFSYSFAWEGMHSRHAVIFFHNDGPIFGGDRNDPNRYFPYHANSPSNLPNLGPYNYYKDGEYPVSMLIPPNSPEDKDNYIPQGYRFIPHNGFTKKPVLFVHGLTGTFSHQKKDADQENTATKGDQVSYWFDTERKLNAKMDYSFNRIYHAWQFYYPNEDDLVHCGMMLENAVNYLDKKYNEPINFVAHSMGGLVTMEYLTKEGNYSPDKIGKVILSMSPIHGSLGGNRNYGSDIGVLMQYFGLDGKAPCYRDMSYGSRFYQNLHSRDWPEKLVENTISFVGLTTNKYKAPGKIMQDIHLEAHNHSDGLVSYSSASLLDKGIGFVAYYGNHDDGKYSKTLKSKSFVPELIHRFFSDQTTDLNSFFDFCQLVTTVEAVVDKNSNVIKPAGTTLQDLAINKEDVNFQKGSITLSLSDYNENALYLYHREKISGFDYVLASSLFIGFPDYYITAGRFNKNQYNNAEQNNSVYYYTNKLNVPTTAILARIIAEFGTPVSGIGLVSFFTHWGDTGFNFLSDTKPLYYRTFLGKDTHIADIEPLYSQHQFIYQSPESYLFAASPSELSPIKYFSISENPGGSQAIFVDDQTDLAIFNLYSPDLEYYESEYSFDLINPAGDTIVISNRSNDREISESIANASSSITNPMPGAWDIVPDYDSSIGSEINFISQAEFSSGIILTSLIEESGHNINQPIEIAGKITVPGIEYLDQNSFEAYAVLQRYPDFTDTLIINNFQMVEDGFIFTDHYLTDVTDVFHYSLIVKGIYNNFTFERFRSGQFIVENLLPIFIIPDFKLNNMNRMVEIYFPHYFSCPLCDMSEVTFEVGLINSTFDEEDFYYFFDSGTNTLTLNVDENSPLAEANFFVDAVISDSIIANTEFRVTYTSPGVPDLLFAYDITLNSAKVSWAPKGSEQHWDIKYGPPGFKPETEGTLISATSENPYLMQGLAQSKAYDFYVRAFFDDDNQSAWSWPASFTTNHIIIANSGDNGQLVPEGSIEISHRNSQLFEIIPSTGYHIGKVFIDGDNIGAVDSYLFEDTQQSHTISAEFAINVYSIEAQPNNDAFGTVSGSGNFEHFAVVTLTAIPATGYHFINWTENGELVSFAPVYSFAVDSDRELTANFAINVYSIEAQPNNETFGSVSGSGNYEHFEEVTLSATPATGYHFINWTENGQLVSFSPVYSFAVDSDRNLTANFAINVYSITAQPNNEAFGSVSGSGNYKHFEEVTLTATPATGYHFINWTENEAEVSTSPSFVFIVEAARQLVANFELETSVVYLDGHGITIYPNPFNHSFTIQSVSNMQQVIMTNLLGQQVLIKQLIGSETTSISTENLPGGVYLVHIIMENGGRKTVKMIKK